MKQFLVAFLALVVLQYGCSTANDEGAGTEDLDANVGVVEEPEIIPWEDVPDTSSPECIECKMYFCPPLDSIWQKEICMNICEDPPTLHSETPCTEYMECDPTQYLIASLECITEDGYPGMQDKLCNKGKIEYTDCVTECYEEACNGIDDDCDDKIDENQLNVCGECGIVPPEVCDGVDNDCNGDTDEDLIQSCSTICGNGYEVCEEGNWISCSAPQPQRSQLRSALRSCLVRHGHARRPPSTTSRFEMPSHLAHQPDYPEFLFSQDQSRICNVWNTVWGCVTRCSQRVA